MYGKFGNLVLIGRQKFMNISFVQAHMSVCLAFTVLATTMTATNRNDHKVYHDGHSNENGKKN